MASEVEASFVAIVLVAMFAALFIGWRTPETVVFMCLVLVWNAGIVTTSEALSGFSNSGMLAVGALFVVVKGVERSQLADKAARRVFGLDTNFTSGLVRMMALCFFLSAFLNNTPVVALLIPITRDWARTRGFSPSQFLIPLSYSCIFGGILTVIGTSTNLVVQGLVVAEGKEGLGFFEPGYIGLPLGILGMIYLTFAAPRILPTHGGLFRFVRDRAEDLLTEVQVLKGFHYIGQSVTLALARLGLPQETLIKVRRRVPKEVLRQIDLEAGLYAQRGGGGGGAASALNISVGSEASIHPPSHPAATICFEESAGMSLRSTCTSKDYYRKRAQSYWGTKGDLACLRSSRGGRDGGTALEPQPPPRTMVTCEDDGAPGQGMLFRLHSLNDNEHHQPLVGAPSGKERGGGGDFTTAAVTDTPAPRPTGLDSTHSTAGYTDIYPVTPGELVQEGDILFLSCGRMTMVAFQGSTMSQGLEGLKLLEVSALDLPGRGTDFFELVLSDRNHFVGRSPGRDNASFAGYYGCSVVAVRRKGSVEATSAAASVANPGPFVAQELAASGAPGDSVGGDENSTSTGAQAGAWVEGKGRGR
ncbi:unnamed protein product, partial [Discosporangium mesarthrocarpum]